jgi:hypothetical protein
LFIAWCERNELPQVGEKVTLKNSKMGMIYMISPSHKVDIQVSPTINNQQAGMS